MGVVCSLSLWGNIRLWQSNRQYADDALKFRAIRSWGGCTPEDILWLNKVFDIHRDEKAIEWVRKQADGYENDLKAVSDREYLPEYTRPRNGWRGTSGRRLHIAGWTAKV